MEYIYIGKIVNTHGIKGELRIRSDFEKKEIIFTNGFKLYIGKNKNEEIVSTYRKHKEFDMVTFKGYNNINEVIHYKGQNVFINREDLNLNNNEYVLDDLIGMEIIDNNECLGKVSDFMYNSSNVLLCISGEKDFYIPYQGNYIESVDIKNNKIYTKNVKDLII